jgi:hypothetical protein
VCLPHPHQGGQLRISHKGGETVWDWSNETAESIKWAAFYSDCEHEVHEVQSGHRVTLTYNLYVHERLGAVLRRHPTTCAESYPLFLKVKELLADPGFLSPGKFDNDFIWFVVVVAGSYILMFNKVAHSVSIVLMHTHTLPITTSRGFPSLSKA